MTQQQSLQWYQLGMTKVFSPIGNKRVLPSLPLSWRN